MTIGRVLQCYLMQRTDWTEQFAADLASKPLVREFVFANARYQAATEREVCDLILTLRNRAILAQMKSQEDPKSRSGTKLEHWVTKKAKEATTQLQGAIRSVNERDFWCQHPRRGKVDFKKGQLSVAYGIVMVEQLAERIPLGDEFPLEYQGVPIGYFSANDFLNVVYELRSFPDILDYLTRRHDLGLDVRRAIGGEKLLCGYYFLNDGSFCPGASYQQISSVVAQRREELPAIIYAKKSADSDADLAEFVADALAERHPGYAEGLSQDVLGHFEDPEQRKAYLLMQENICDLRLAERRAMGSQLRTAIVKVQTSKQDSDFAYASAYVDSKPQFLYVLGASRQVPRPELLERGQILLRGGLAFFQKRDGLLIIDRDGQSFETMLIQGFSPSEGDKQAGQRLFGSLRIFDVRGGIVPGDRRS